MNAMLPPLPNTPADPNYPLVQNQRHLSFGVPFTFVIGNPALGNAGTLGATFKWDEDVVLDSFHVEYGVSMVIQSAGYGIGDTCGAFLIQGTNAGTLNPGGSTSAPNIMWNRADNLLGTAAGNFQGNFQTGADITVPGKRVNAGTSMSLYLIVPSVATTQVQYGVWVTFNYWSLDAYTTAIRQPRSFLAQNR